MAHRVFVSYCHREDQGYADELRSFYGSNDALIDRSLPEEIDSDDDDYVIGRIRTEHLKDSTVTIVLIGTNAWTRKWVDWEIYSSLRPYRDRTINGLLGITLPGAKVLPRRFADSFRVERLFGREVQTGYAKLVSWDCIAPPAYQRLDTPSQPETQMRRARLMEWVEAAFRNRDYPGLIAPSRTRMRRNLSPWERP